MKLSLSQPWLYLITDRTACDRQDVLTLVEMAARAGVDLIQIREKDLPVKAVCHLVERAATRTASSKVRILVNDRLDVALSCGVHGVHLTTQSLPTAVARKIVGSDFLIGVSTHSMAQAKQAETEGADFIVLGPVFETPSKASFGPPLGLAAFADIVRSVTIPVLALGGINLQNFHQVLDQGASGIAAIRLFAGASALEEVVTQMKGYSQDS
jgi:thiamine-phosphate pyrophosphorylase